MNKFLAAAIATVATSGSAMAHPGEHAFTVAGSLVHLLTEPDHLAMIAVGASVLGVAYVLRKRRSV
jgi:hypothetical protein